MNGFPCCSLNKWVRHKRDTPGRQIPIIPWPQLMLSPDFSESSRRRYHLWHVNQCFRLPLQVTQDPYTSRFYHWFFLEALGVATHREKAKERRARGEADVSFGAVGSFSSDPPAGGAGVSQQSHCPQGPLGGGKGRSLFFWHRQKRQDALGPARKQAKWRKLWVQTSSAKSEVAKQ